MKVLIVSDTHRRNDNYLRVLEREGPLDVVIHCGDSEGSEYLICESAGCLVHIVQGNNDFFSVLPKDLEFSIGPFRAFLTHGHTYHVSMGNEALKQAAKARGAHIVFYGHTHRPLIEKEKDIIAVNPGSISLPRQEGQKPTYIVMELDENEEFHFELKYV